MHMNVNREHKSSVFTALFDNEDRVRELYAALKGVDYDPALPIVITTLRDALYMNRINDLSFTVDCKFVLIVEHQSGLNRNMPLRILLYIARVYEKIVDRRSLYRDALVKIPAPEFIVLYNGTEETPDRWEERLSGAFLETEEGAKNALDLTVTVYNINKGRNQELLGRSEHLAGYAEFVARARENEKTMPLEEAITEAVRQCVRQGILADFLEEHSSEVMNMLLEEWNWDEAKEVWREEVWEQAEAKYQPVIAEKDRENQAIKREMAEKDQTLAEKDREIAELRRQLEAR
jgi:hypothetical protein